jgi:hypothetical protein
VSVRFSTFGEEIARWVASDGRLPNERKSCSVAGQSVKTGSSLAPMRRLFEGTSDEGFTVTRGSSTTDNSIFHRAPIASGGTASPGIVCGHRGRTRPAMTPRSSALEAIRRNAASTPVGLGDDVVVEEADPGSARAGNPGIPGKRRASPLQANELCTFDV